jgi:hypothetical protein
MTDQKEIKLVFEPGCFDGFEGSQEELDELVATIKDMFTNKTPEDIKNMGRAVDMEELIEEDPELAEAILRQVGALDSEDTHKKLH